jgi:hypothetical protein
LKIHRSWVNYFAQIEQDLRDGVLLATLLKHLLALEGVVADIDLDSNSKTTTTTTTTDNNDNNNDDNNDDDGNNQAKPTPRNPLDRLREFFKALKSSSATKFAYLPPTINAAGVCFVVFFFVF